MIKINLKEERQKLGISQTKMAIKLDMSTQNYVKYERGEYVNMNEEIRLKIANILNNNNYSYERI